VNARRERTRWAQLVRRSGGAAVEIISRGQRGSFWERLRERRLMVGLVAFWSSNLAQELTNFMGGPIQTAEGVGGLSILAMGYRLVNCQQTGCRRIGRFAHGHLRLCHRHHPLVPDDGVITATQIDAVTAAQSRGPQPGAGGALPAAAGPNPA
jgi:hypothetical protein